MATGENAEKAFPTQKAVWAPREYTEFTLDTLISFIAGDTELPPILACASFTGRKVEWEYFNAGDLDRFTEHAARFLEGSGLKPQEAPQVVGMIGHSDLSYVVCMLALSRLGYTPFLLSPSLSIPTMKDLCSKEGVITMLVGRNTDTPREMVGLFVDRILDAPTREEYDKPDPGTRQYPLRGKDDAGSDTTLIMHSSGTSGEPRPIHWGRKRFASLFVMPLGYSLYVTVPLYHTHGFTMMFQSFFGKKICYLHDQKVKMSPGSLYAAISTADPQTIFTVPLVLKILAETEEGIQLLVGRLMVSWAGTRLPDELGDMLVSRGVHLGTIFGSTETGLLLESLLRPQGDTDWNYLSIPAHVKPFIHMKPEQNPVSYAQGQHTPTYECIVLPGYDSCDVSNSDQPPGSYHTGDLFVPNAEHTKWKFVARRDDRFTLAGGRHVHPQLIEGFVKQSPHVKEAVVFGAGRPVPGILVFRASEDRSDMVKPPPESGSGVEEASGGQDSSSGRFTYSNALAARPFDFVSFYDDFVLPGSKKSEPCVVIPPECTIVFGPEQEYAKTDKGSVMRGKALDDCKARIEEAYQDYLARV